MFEKTDVPEVKKAVLILHEMSADEEMREIARLREKAVLDEASARDYYTRTARAEGMAKGMAKGRAEGEKAANQRTAERLRKLGMTKEQIKEILQ